ncbi:hypothetical protein GOBAR_DD36106 [Gossypium barbadense]|nr:hypothetical protein GOBAR_DD36106 [Gossypium barbadense]
MPLSLDDGPDGHRGVVSLLLKPMAACLTLVQILAVYVSKPRRFTLHSVFESSYVYHTNNEEQRRRGMTNESFCTRCGESSGTALHAVRDCHFATRIWRDIVPAATQISFFATSIDNWLLWSLTRGDIVLLTHMSLASDRLTGFSMEVGESDVFQVEARAIDEGLMFAWSRGFRQVKVETDNVVFLVD